MLQVAIDVHRGPCEDVHTWAQLVLQVFQVGHEERFGVGADLVDDAVVLAEHKGELVVVHLELLFLEENDLGALRDLNSDTGEAFGLTDQGHDLTVEVDVEAIVAGITDDERGEKTSFGLLNLDNPSLPPFILEVEEGVGDAVVVGHLLDCLLSLLGAEMVTGELLHGRRGAVEQVTGPGDGTRHDGQVTHDGWVGALLLVLFLNLGDKARVLVEKDTVLAHETSL